MPFHADIQAYTSFPTVVGARATLEGPARLRLSLGGGLLPTAYLNAIDNTATANGWYDDQTSEVIQAALEHSAEFSAHLGWRPFPKHGFQFELGYGFAGLGGGLTAGEVLAIETGYNIPADTFPASFSYTLTANLHRAEVSAGWEWVFARHFIVRVDLGGSFTVATKATLKPNFDVPWFLQSYEDDFETNVTSKLEQTFDQSVQTPILAVGAGYRF